MRQKSRLTTIWKAHIARLLAAMCLALMVTTLGTPQVFAIDPPGVQPIRPAPRPTPTPTPRVTPRSLVAPVPKVAPGPRFGLTPGLVRPRVYGPNCIGSCGSRCQMVSCSGLNVSQCASVRQQCRISCRTRC